MVYSPAQPPEPMIRRWLPSPSPSPSPSPAQPLSSILTTVTNNTQPPQPSKLPIYFSPPLIAMVVIAAAAFLLVTYSRLISRKLLPPIFRLHHKFRRWRRRRRRSIHRHPSSSFNALDSPPLYLSDGFGSATTYSPYGLDESAIRAMPLSIYSEKARLIEEFSSDCAVCLLEFEENDYVRTLPHCCHSFHVECIDAWLRSHATCPLCRAGLFPLDSSSPPLFSPLMAARIRPSLDEGLLESLFYLDPLPESFQRTTPTSNPLRTPGRRVSASDFNGGDAEIEVESLSASTPHDRSDMVLKRSYSFGFERSFVSSAMTTSPSWRFHQHRRGGSSFWRRPSPFGSITKSRVFSFRSYRGVGGTGGGLKSPFFFSSRRRGFAPLSESAGIRYSSSSASHYYHHHQCCHLYCCSGSSAGVGGGGSSSRRSKSFASPMMCGGRMSVTASSRMRCGDPEALLSPERFGRR